MYMSRFRETLAALWRLPDRASGTLSAGYIAVVASALHRMTVLRVDTLRWGSRGYEAGKRDGKRDTNLLGSH